jgi:hypothetical protein
MTLPVLLSYSTSMDAEVTNLGIGIHHPLLGKALKDKNSKFPVSFTPPTNGSVADLL